jgi:hypothetical protein
VGEVQQNYPHGTEKPTGDHYWSAPHPVREPSGKVNSDHEADNDGAHQVGRVGCRVVHADDVGEIVQGEGLQDYARYSHHPAR